MTLSELFDKADEIVTKRYPDCNASIKEMNSYRDGYIHGMTEKLEGMIPIEKACEYLRQSLYNTPIFEHDEDETPVNYVCTSCCDSVEEFIGNFRKSMEE